MTEDERRSRYAEALRRLSEFFPSQCTEKRKVLYFEQLLRGNSPPDDVDKAVDRLIDTRQSDRFPPWADLADRLVDLAKDRRGEQHVDHSNEPRLDNTPKGRAAMLEIFRAGRAMDMPAPKPDISNDREYRRKKLGIKPLTQAEIDMLNRRKCERAAARLESKRRPASAGEPEATG